MSNNNETYNSVYWQGEKVGLLTLDFPDGTRKNWTFTQKSKTQFTFPMFWAR